MMASYQYSIELTSDAEPGSGLGSDLINNLAPRDHWRQPVLLASHVKGLMRQSFRDIATPLDWNPNLETQVFGKPDEYRPGIDSTVRLTDAVASEPHATSLITRAAVQQESGVALDKSLRTTEAVAVGTVFTGEIYTSVIEDSVEDLVWRLALLTIPAVGANRNRGSGACIINIAGESRSPGDLLRALHEHQKKWQADVAQTALPAAPSLLAVSPQSTVLRLTFYARTPICCPEIPNKTNVLSTGLSIPASAVQGVILHRLNASDPALATAVFHSNVFRAWPLHPCWYPASATEQYPEELPSAIRVSLTHRVAKWSLSDNPEHKDFFDPAIERQPLPLDGAPLKAADGVLLSGKDGVQLWKATDMPRVLTAHGVRNDPHTPDNRNLFTIDAMAPLVWQGLVIMPQDAAERLLQSLQQDPIVAFGKSRSVLGIGALQARVDASPSEWQTPEHLAHTVLVVQSPLLLPEPSNAGRNANTELANLGRNWAMDRALIEEKDPVEAWANVGIRFGWNRHLADSPNSGRQAACRVAQAGSVIAFSKRLDATHLEAALRQGFGEVLERQRGFGAVSVHPGTASKLYEPQPALQKLSGARQLKEAIELVLAMRREAAHLPSPSQIRAIQQRLEKSDKPKTLDYLAQQLQRSTRIWSTWESIHHQMETLLGFEKSVALKALEILADLAIVDQQQGG